MPVRAPEALECLMIFSDMLVSLRRRFCYEYCNFNQILNNNIHRIHHRNNFHSHRRDYNRNWCQNIDCSKKKKTEVSGVSIDMRDKIRKKIATWFASKKVLIYCIIVGLISAILYFHRLAKSTFYGSFCICINYSMIFVTLEISWMGRENRKN
jgi:hypothetical protein